MSINTAGFSVGAGRVAPLAALSQAQVQGFNANAFQGDGGESFVKGMAAGTAAAKPLADVINELNPESVAKRKLALAQLEFAGRVLPAQQAIEERKLDYEGALLGLKTDAMHEGFNPKSMQPPNVTAAPNLPPAKVTVPDQVEVPDVSQKPLASFVPTDKADPFALNGTILSPRASASKPLADAGNITSDAQPITISPNPEINSSVLADQQRAIQLKNEQDDLAKAFYLKDVNPTAANYHANETELNKKVNELGMNPFSMTRDEKMAALHNVAPDVVEARKAAVSDADRFTSIEGNKNFNKSLSAYNQMLSTVKQAGGKHTGADDLALINNFINTVTPGQTVRPIEIETIEQATPYLSKFNLKFGKLSPNSTGNLLTDAQVKQMLATAHSQVSGTKPTYMAELEKARHRAQIGKYDASVYGDEPVIQDPNGSPGQPGAAPKAYIPGAKATTSSGWAFKVSK